MNLRISMSNRARVAWLAAALLFLGVFASHLRGHMGCSDSRWSIPTAASLLDERDFDLDEYEALIKERGFYFTERVGGHHYTVYPFGASILAAPAVLVLRPVASAVFTRWPSWEMSMRASQFVRGCPPANGEPVIDLHSWTEQITASGIVALTTVLLYLIARAELPMAGALAVALIFAFGTSAWSTASRSLWQHGPSMLMLAAALYAQRRGGRWLLLAGVALAFSYVVRPTNAIPLALGSAWVAWNHPRRLAGFLAGVAAVLVPFVVLNQSVYGAWLSPYYHPATHHGNPFFWEALAGGFVSPGRGLFVYSPVLAFAAAGIAIKIRQHRFTSLDFSLLAGVLLHWISTALVNPSWWGGDSYGPRFSTDILPYLIYWIVPVVAWLRRATGLRRALAGGAFVLSAATSVLMHAQGVFNPKAMSWNQEPPPLTMDPSRLWDWRHPPFLAGFVAPAAVERLPDLAAIPCDSPPGPPTGLTILSNRSNDVSGSWQAPSGFAGIYVIETGSAPGLSDLPPRETQMTEFTVKRIPAGTYFSRIRAKNACGVSAPSNEIRVVVE